LNNSLLAVIADAPVRAGTNPEMSSRDTLRTGEALAERTATRPETAAPVIAVTLGSMFVRSCKDWERPRLVATSRSR
jgi:hypothetical protein